MPFPSLDAVSKQDPLARALYDFDHGKEDHLLVFNKVSTYFFHKLSLKFNAGFTIVVNSTEH